MRSASVAILTALVLIAPVRSGADQPKPISVTIGYTSTVPSAITWTSHPVLLSRPEFFEKAGIAVSPLSIQMGDAVQMMMGGNPPIVEGTGLGTVASGFAAGATDVRIFLAETQRSPYALVMKKGMTKPAELKTLGVPGMTSASAQTCQQLLRDDYNLQVNRDYRMVLVGTAGARVAAVAAGTIDGSCETIPNPQLYHDQYGLTLVPIPHGGVPSFAAGAWAYSTKWAAADPEHREILVRIAEAVLMATRWSYDPRNKQQVIASAMESMQVPRGAAEAFYNAQIGEQILSPDAYIPKASALGVLQAMVDIQAIPAIPKDIGQYFDWSILQTAADRLKIKIRKPEY